MSTATNAARETEGTVAVGHAGRGVGGTPPPGTPALKHALGRAINSAGADADA